MAGYDGMDADQYERDLRDQGASAEDARAAADELRGRQR